MSDASPPGGAGGPHRSSLTPRRFVALTAFLAIIALRVEPQLLNLPFQDRAPLAQAFNGYADRLWPQYPRFLEGVRAHTRPGDRVAVIVPSMQWDSGYSYAYYRASYFLTGREVLPLVLAEDVPHSENFRAAKYVAVWNAAPPPGEVVWRGEGGVLLKR
jgi:hypothetical protein